MSVNFSENIPTVTETMTQKFSILYFYWECQATYPNSFFKHHNTHLLHLFVDMYILKLFFLKKKKHDFARLMFSVKKFQETGIKSLFLSFQNSFSASYFPVSQEALSQNSLFTPL